VSDFSASIVIPAHHEEAALPRQLASLLNQDLEGNRLHVVVVVNGSIDTTADAARTYVTPFRDRGHRLEVVEIATPSKANALNLGDEVATVFPRLYLDADITLSVDAIRRTIDALTSVQTPLLAAPRIHIADCKGIVARHYGHLWSQLPYIREQVPGVGFYAVNEPGRRLWSQFPVQLGADDKYVRLHFGSDQMVVVEKAAFSIYLPQRIIELLQVRGRWNEFNLDLARERPDLSCNDSARWRTSAMYLAGNPRLWPFVPLFLMVWCGAWAFTLLAMLGLGRRWARASSSPIRTKTLEANYP
jgi:glycosyltransferase involved in cell wall biosynthesis